MSKIKQIAVRVDYEDGAYRLALRHPEDFVGKKKEILRNLVGMIIQELDLDEAQRVVE